MTIIVKSKDTLLKHSLESLSIQNDEYWSFKGNSTREYAHGLCQYPAMMVPQLTRVILDNILCVYPEIKNIGDPFMGSGTVLTETMMRGLNFSGIDINPLSLLICKVKKGPYLIDKLKQKINAIKRRLENDSCKSVDIAFTNIDKWFTEDVQIDLCKIRRCIKDEDDSWIRNFLWVALVETVKNTSNSRTSTFKLHIRNQDDLAKRNINTIYFFIKIIERNISLLEKQRDFLKRKKYILSDKYIGNINISIDDIRNNNFKFKNDVIITSPPYGDNATTVPYGQYSYLPLQWVDIKDITENIPYDTLANTHAIDAASLGGNLRVTQGEYSTIGKRSPTFLEYAEKIKDEPKDRIQRVSSFLRDLDNSLPAILDSLSPSGLMVWVLGNRKVGGERVPFDKILTELLASYNADLVCKLTRSIPSKRMAAKNSFANTISKESIIVIRKTAQPQGDL